MDIILWTSSLSHRIERSLFRTYVLAIVVPKSELQRQRTQIIKTQFSALHQALSDNGNSVDLRDNRVFCIGCRNRNILVSFFLNLLYLLSTISLS